jgi:hypothetical protein
MTPDTLVGLLADPGRLRVFSAIALGAGSDAETAVAAGLSPRDAAAARRRLAEGGAIEATPSGWTVATDRLRQLARDGAARAQTAAGDELQDRRLAPFVVGGTLASLPAAPARRRVVLEHVAATSFDLHQLYDERAVDARLRPWCEGGQVDHVALRRYLVEAGLLLRGNGVYALPTPGRTLPQGVGERSVAALGLD